MTEPAQLPARHVEVSRVQPEPAHQLVRCDAQAPRVRARDAAHAAQAAPVERAQLLQQLLSEAPALAPVKEESVYQFIIC